jgi:hypothetical protein
VTVGLAATSTTREDFAAVFYDLRFTHSGAEQRSASPAPESWTSLFNGKDLTGWEAHPQRRGNWRVEVSLLTGSGPGALSHLFTVRDDFTDFRLRAQMKLSAGSDSGIHARCRFAPQADKNYLGGYEVNATTTGAVLKTGTLYDPADALAPVTVDCIRADEWFTLELIAEGNHWIVRVNDTTVVDCFDPKNSARRGRISLQQFGNDTVVQFRQIEIQERAPTPPAAKAEQP